MLWRRFFKKGGLSLSAGLLSLASVHSVTAAPAQEPLFLTQPVRPIMMLNMSNDHQLFFKLYDDYSDLDGDGVPDTGYINDFDYFGYFDSLKCYAYDDSSDRFEPDGEASETGFCNVGGESNQWSGNFLNWASMTRMDAVRKILYGGKRDLDTPDETVLERAFLPNDAHSFAKYYNGPNMAKLTPFSVTSNLSGTTDMGITICNTTDGSGLSQDATEPPLLKVAKGNFSLWASNERSQCLWGERANGNDPDVTGIMANGSSPERNVHGLGEKDYQVRVQTCASGIDEVNNEGCQAYDSSLKPTGLLQTFGETGAIHFGLITGSYDRNKSGGVLRKNVGDIKDEIDPDNGTFVVPSAEEAGNFNGIISTLEKLRIYGYRFGNNTYFRGSHGKDPEGSDGCKWITSSFDDGHCSNWGNPQSEIYLESLRYLAGLQPTGEFLADDSDRIDGLNTAVWEKPVTNENFCAPLNIIQFNASVSSFDSDNLGSASGLGFGETNSVNSATNAIGDSEGISGNDFFVGEILGGTGTETNQLCTAKTVSNLADVRGTCPDAPRLQGSYQIAGLASLARTSGIPLTGVNKPSQTVRTFGVALAPAVPSVTIPVPNSESKTINIQPACREQRLNPPGGCAILDFKIIEQDQEQIDGKATQIGKLYINWESNEHGGDFDQDMWGILDYKISDSTVEVTTVVLEQSTGGEMGFGYIISGTTDDGFKVHSGINDFVFGDICDEPGSCELGSPPNTQTYTVGGSTAKPLEQPLYYAAKWGGFADDDASLETIRDNEPENFFFATDPRELQSSLKTAFSIIEDSIGSASSVATNSTRLLEGSFVYQARFESGGWTGEILAFEVGEDGDIDGTPTRTTDDTMVTSSGVPAGRNVLTFDPGSGDTVEFAWAKLNDTQKSKLEDGGDEALGMARLNWLLGDKSNEGGTDGLRERDADRLLGDIVNSSPVLLSGRDFGYSRLEDGGGSYGTYVTKKRNEVSTLFVGANDGMLHAFKGEGSNLLDEQFAFVPNGVYAKLTQLTDPDYGRDPGHEFTVDGPLALGDAYIDVGGGDKEWRSILVGTLGAGGKGVFALDVTPGEEPTVLFEFSDADFPELGFVLGRPFVVPMADGSWAAVFGNGYESSTSSLFVVDLENPDTPRIIDTEGGNGLSAVTLLPDATGVVQKAYAGDLKGNMWKFDLSDDNPGNWDVAFQEGGDPAPLFQAEDKDDTPGTPQPITGAPTLGLNAQKDNAVMVYFGTGKYFDPDDNSTAMEAQSSFYAVADTGEPLGDRNDVTLHEKELADLGLSRTVNNSEVDWTEPGLQGWVLDFDTVAGERVTVKPILRFDRLIFPTLIPSDVACNFGGNSFLMELTAIGDRFIGEDLLGENAFQDSLILGQPSFNIIDKDKAKLLFNLADGSMGEGDSDLPPSAFGRQSWRQLQ